MFREQGQSLNWKRTSRKREIKNISKDDLTRVIDNFRKWMKLIIHAGGGHLENKWFEIDKQKSYFFLSLKLSPMTRRFKKKIF